MNLQWLYFFNELADAEHYIKTANKLHVSESYLSYAIKQLEGELGVRLFERSGRNVKLTKYGRFFHDYTRRAVDTLEEGVHAIKQSVDPNVGTITAAGFQSLASFATDLMLRYQSDTNRLDVQFKYSLAVWKEILPKLLSGAADVVISTRVDSDKISSAYLGVHPMVALVPKDHPIAKLGQVNLNKFNGCDFIAFDGESHMRGVLDNYFKQHDIKINVIAESANDVIIYKLVAAKRGVSVVPLPLDGAPYGTVIVPIADEIAARKIYLSWNKNRYMSPAAQCFCDYVIKNNDVLNQYLKFRRLNLRILQREG